MLILQKNFWRNFSLNIRILVKEITKIKKKTELHWENSHILRYCSSMDFISGIYHEQEVNDQLHLTPVLHQIPMQTCKTLSFVMLLGRCISNYTHPEVLPSAVLPTLPGRAISHIHICPTVGLVLRPSPTVRRPLLTLDIWLHLQYAYLYTYLLIK